ATAEGREDKAAEARNDLLLPILKGVGSERSYEMLTHSLQTLGGSGFLQDYPIEQYIRDAKIDSLYEGTTAIQSMDLFFRKMVRDQGAAANALIAEISEFAASEAGNGRLKTEREAIADGVTQVQAIIARLTEYTLSSLEKPEEIYKVGQNSVRLLYAFGDLVIAWLLGRQAEVAIAALDKGDLPESESDFYTGKIAAAKFFAANVLPRLESERKIVDATTNDLMDIPEGAF
ncbi:MAG: acyl-CoA dehydrogenase, partial [Nocardiopsaceae bacterium]|nr:acyl-CoA dehydrogenase [Nocardiopsaceae bacterium]